MKPAEAIVSGVSGAACSGNLDVDVVKLNVPDGVKRQKQKRVQLQLEKLILLCRVPAFNKTNRAGFGSLLPFAVSVKLKE